MEKLGNKHQEWLAERKKKIEYMYHSSLMSQKEIGKVLNLSQSVISAFMSSNNIKTRDSQYQKGRQTLGKDHPGWVGDKVCYMAAHQRVYRLRGKALECTKCGKTEGLIHWANITGRYYDPEDYMELCPKCHSKFDGRTTSVPIECFSCKVIFTPYPYRVRKYKNVFCSKKCAQAVNIKVPNVEELKYLYALGKTQDELALYFKVCKGTITNTLRRNKIRRKDMESGNE